jgi:transcriptional regulator with XRE-family HTH domain
MNKSSAFQAGPPTAGAETRLHGVPIDLQLQEFGKALQAAYIGAGLSKRAVAGATGLDRSAISQIERGSRAPGFGKLLLLARAAKSTPAALLEGVGACDRAIPAIVYDGRTPADPLRRFGANLRWLRAHMQPCMSQEGLALEANIDRSSPNGYETGRMRPNLRTILKLAAGLRVAPSMLLEGVELGDRRAAPISAASSPEEE